MPTIKRFDTATPISGIARDANGRVNLSVYATIWFQMKATINSVSVLVTGQAVDVEAIDGAGGTDPTDGLPVNRGRWRYLQLSADVSQPGNYSCELECRTAAGKKVHFPNTAAANPTLTIDADLDNA